MRERAQKIGGRIEVANLPGRGFRVRLKFPPSAGGGS
jgi:signal transduction histidine kinase